jgi:hypothetical protein
MPTETTHAKRFFNAIKAHTHYAPVEIKKGAQGLIRAYQRSASWVVLFIVTVCIVLNDLEKMPGAIGTAILVMAGAYIFFLVAMGALYAAVYLISLLFLRPMFIIREGRLQILFAGAETTTKGEGNAQAEEA